MLELKNYTVSTENKSILKDINVTFEKGKVYALMGPNGSGKSTLALSLAGAPQYSIRKNAEAILHEEDILSLKTEERAKKGLYIALQSPPALTGVTVFQMLRIALSQKIKPLDLRNKMAEYAEKLHVPSELLSRSLNEGFSGGERKKLEVLQLALLDPQIIFFDEIDTGVDVDALKVITAFLKDFHTPEKTYILITHYTRILEYLNPDEVLILKNGTIAKTGDASLADKIEQNGYESIKS